MAAEVGTGATLTLGTTAISLEATSISSSGVAWSALETTYLGTTGAKTFVRGDLYDPGEVTVEFWANPSEMDTLLTNAASEVITITYPDSGGATEVATGFVTSWDPSSIEVEGLITGSLTFKRTGAIVFTD